MHSARRSIPFIYASERTITCTVPGSQSLAYILTGRRPLHAPCQALNRLRERAITYTVPGVRSLSYMPARGPLHAQCQALNRLHMHQQGEDHYMHRARLSIACIYINREKTITCTVPGSQSLAREDHYMHSARRSIPSIYASERTITCTVPGSRSIPCIYINSEKTITCAVSCSLNPSTARWTMHNNVPEIKANK